MEEGSVTAERRATLAKLRQAGPAYPNDFSRTHYARQLVEQHGAVSAAELEKLQATATIAGRLALRQESNGETLARLEDGSGALQISVSDAASGSAGHAAFREWDLGDVVGVMGILYRASEGELTLRAHELRLLVKSLRPVPDQAELRRLLQTRSRLLAGIRDSMRGTQYMEVETPLLHPAADPAASGAPLETYHNALGVTLYLRSGPGLYLQRLLIGGIEKIYEINRSFGDRDGGGRRPEFTTMEIYCAYANHSYMMSLLERVIAHATLHALGTTAVSCGGEQLDLGAAFARMTFAESRGKKLLAPTFVVDYPAEATPRARRKDHDPALAEQFRLFVGGEAIAEGMSLLNDPEAPAGYDADFVRALEYGMPPTAGARLDLDALVGLLTGVPQA